MVDARLESDKARRARVQINRLLNECRSIIVSAGISPIMIYAPSPAVGGYVQRVDIFTNLFNLHTVEISPDAVFDHIDRAIGVYEREQFRAWMRTFNPFFWLGLLLDLIVEIPFSLLGKAGFNKTTIEESLLGRVAKAVMYLVTLLASLLTILELTGYLETFNSLLRTALRSN